MPSPRVKALAARYAWRDTWTLVKSRGFASTGVILAIATFFHGQMGMPWWLAATLDVVILTTIVWVYYEIRYRKHYDLEAARLNVDNVYGDALEPLNTAFASIHLARRAGGTATLESTKALTALCEQLRKIFDNKAGKGCSICIKVVPDDEGPVVVDTAVRTLCRDGIATGKPERNSVDLSTHVHDIFSNTSFRNFFLHMNSPKGAFYMNNDLPGTKDYESTSFKVRGEPKDWNPATKQYDSWPLAYKSEIVVPICPYGHTHQKERPLIYGYLCVDSPAVNVFNDTYDVQILRGVADGIVDVIQSFVSRKSTEPAQPAVPDPVNTGSHGGHNP